MRRNAELMPTDKSKLESAVAAQARLRIDHADLTALLYAQGYRQEEFVV